MTKRLKFRLIGREFVGGGSSPSSCAEKRLPSTQAFLPALSLETSFGGGWFAAHIMLAHVKSEPCYEQQLLDRFEGLAI